MITNTTLNFHTTEQKTVNKIVIFTIEKFIDTLNLYQPKEIWNSEYSSKIPCWTITEYLGNNRVKYYASGWADKTPVEDSMEKLYKEWCIQGLERCYINKSSTIEFVAVPFPHFGFGGGFKALNEHMQRDIYEISCRLKQISNECPCSGWDDKTIEKISKIQQYLQDDTNMIISYKENKKPNLISKLFNYFK